jgi:UDPglucose 6-dehydrogenase
MILLNSKDVMSLRVDPKLVSDNLFACSRRRIF